MHSPRQSKRFIQTALSGCLLLGLLAPAAQAAPQADPPVPPTGPSVERHHAEAFDIEEAYRAPTDPVLAPATTELAPEVSAWSRLAFVSFRNLNTFDVYRANGDGTAPTFLATDGDAPNINRGGSRVAYMAVRNNNVEVYAVNADGSGNTNLTNHGSHDYWPAWSPDGTRIVFYSYRDTGNTAELYVMNADGSGVTRLTANGAQDRYPAWSPDGSKIVYVSEATGARRITVMDANGQNVQSLMACSVYCYHPSWSPDGTRIIYNEDATGDGFDDITQINSDGSGRYVLVGSGGQTDFAYPSWAPDGQNIVYSQIHWIYYNGNWYWDSAYLVGRNVTTHGTYALGNSDTDWIPDWESTDVQAPTTQAAVLPVWSLGSFTVQWGGTDPGGAGLKSYDVQYRVNQNGAWVNWLQNTTQTSATFNGASGSTFYFRVRARDNAFNTEDYPAGNGDAWTTVDTTPPTSAAASPLNAPGVTFSVTWSGSDAGVGLANYDVQYRDGVTGTWTLWQSNTTRTSGLFVGDVGHTYYFRSRARDSLGNLEAYPTSNDGDTATTTPAYALTGRVLNTQAQPVIAAAAQTVAAALNTGASDNFGRYWLYFNQTGGYSLTVAHAGYGTLPALNGVMIPNMTTAPTLYLPPADDKLVDGGFETGGLTAWGTSSDITPVVTTTAHTGNYAVQLGGSAPNPSVTPMEAFTVTQVVSDAAQLLSAPAVAALVDPEAITTTTAFTLTGPIAATPVFTGMQDIGLSFAFTGDLVNEGTPVTMTAAPVTLTVMYSDTAWQQAQVAGEESLALWHYDAANMVWQPLIGVLDTVSNTLVVTTTNVGDFAVLGAAEAAPWTSTLTQTVATSALPTSTLALLYRVTDADPGDALYVYVDLPTETLTYTLPLTANTWTHQWWSVPASAGGNVSVRVVLHQGARTSTTRVVVDELSLGMTQMSSYTLFLPIVRSTALPAAP